jgi:ribonuclease HI
MKKVEIYTDGACKGNPGHGGWAAILVYGVHERVLSGGERVTTNNRMELIAAIEGLKALREPCEVTLYSDSRYLVDAINQGWLKGWRAAGWKRGKEELKNPDLWQELDALLETHRVTMTWVKGHDGHSYNERCDELASGNAARYLIGEEIARRRGEEI